MGIYSPIFIGAIGGSRTRAVAELLHNAGFFMGKKLNHAFDNRLFHLFSQPALSDVLQNKNMINERIDLLRQLSTQTSPDLTQYTHLLGYLPIDGPSPEGVDALKRCIVCEYCPDEEPRQWGFKNPRSHFFCEHILDRLCESHFIYVIRHGLDMVYSQNVRQVQKYGEIFGIKTHFSSRPEDIFSFWMATLNCILEVKNRYPDRVYILRFEDFVGSPLEQSQRLLEFAGCDVPRHTIQQLCRHVFAPDTINRYRHKDLSWVNQAMANFLEKTGYKID